MESSWHGSPDIYDTVINYVASVSGGESIFFRGVFIKNMFFHEENSGLKKQEVVDMPECYLHCVPANTGGQLMI